MHLWQLEILVTSLYKRLQTNTNIIKACKPEKKKKAECDASNNNLIIWLYSVTYCSIKRYSSWDQSNLKHKKHLLFPLSAMSTSTPIPGGRNNSGLVCFNYTWEIHPHSTCFFGDCRNSSWYVWYSTVCYSYIYQTFFLLELNIVHYQPYCRIYLKGIPFFFSFVVFNNFFGRAKDKKIIVSGCKEIQFYSLPFGQAEASLY